MSQDGNSSDSDAYNEKEHEQRRLIRMRQKAACEHLIAHKQDLRNVNSGAFSEAMDVFRESTHDAQQTRELQYESVMLKELSAGAAGQWNGLCDKSARFNWMDFVDSMKARFTIAGEPCINWEKAGGEARMLFNTVPCFNTMVGPIHKEEKFRKMAVRRVRGDNSEVVTTTGLVIENNEEDGNDEATNARVDKLLSYLSTFQDAQFDLLRTLVDPSNPVQSVENFFDFSYLHKGKRVRHAVDEETGLLKGTLTGEEELEHCQKSQMVLSFSMRDMEDMAHILYPEYFKQQRPMRHPLHRDDPLYDCANAQEQVRLLAERAQQQVSQKSQRRSQGASAASQSSRSSTAAGAGGGASRGASSSRAGRSSAAASSSGGRDGRGRASTADDEESAEDVEMPAHHRASSSSSSRAAPAASSSSSSRAVRTQVDTPTSPAPGAAARKRGATFSDEEGGPLSPATGASSRPSAHHAGTSSKRARAESPATQDAFSRATANGRASSSAAAMASPLLGKENNSQSPEGERSDEEDYFHSEESEERVRKPKARAGGRRSYA